MKIGILGAGNVGSALGGAWARHRHDIIFGSRAPEGTAGLARSGSLEEAARFAEVAVIALPWQVAHDVLPSLKLSGKTVIDCTNPKRSAVLAAGSFDSGAQVLQSRVPEARIVKAFNTTGANNMRSPHYRQGRLAMFYCGDSAEARRTTGDLVAQVGFEPFDLGPLANARLMEAQAELWVWLAFQGGIGREFGFQLIRGSDR